MTRTWWNDRGVTEKSGKASELIIIIIILVVIAFVMIVLASALMGAEVVKPDIPCQQEIMPITKKHKKPLTKLMRITAYCPGSCCCGDFADGVTASGAAAEGFLVAAPPNYAFGTIMSIPGYNGGEDVSVEDRGGAIKGDRLDVLFATHQEALNWGVKYLNVETNFGY